MSVYMLVVFSEYFENVQNRHPYLCMSCIIHSNKAQSKAILSRLVWCSRNEIIIFTIDVSAYLTFWLMLLKLTYVLTS